MATDAHPPWISAIGEAAGLVWQILDANGPMSMARLVKVSGQPRDLAMQAIGWLAREDKIKIEEDRRTRVISLR